MPEGLPCIFCCEPPPHQWEMHLLHTGSVGALVIVYLTRASVPRAEAVKIQTGHIHNNRLSHTFMTLSSEKCLSRATSTGTSNLLRPDLLNAWLISKNVCIIFRMSWSLCLSIVTFSEPLQTCTWHQASMPPWQWRSSQGEHAHPINGCLHTTRPCKCMFLFVGHKSSMSRAIVHS